MRLYVMEVLNYKSDVEVTGFKLLKKRDPSKEFLAMYIL